MPPSLPSRAFMSQDLCRTMLGKVVRIPSPPRPSGFHPGKRGPCRTSTYLVARFLGGIVFGSKNRTGENRTGEPRPSTRGPFCGHRRGNFRGESLKVRTKGNQPSRVLSRGFSWAGLWVKFRFRLLCASPVFVAGGMSVKLVQRVPDMGCSKCQFFMHFTHPHIHTCTHFTHLLMDICTHCYICTFTHLHIYTSTSLFMHSHTYICMHLHTDTLYTHTHLPPPQFFSHSRGAWNKANVACSVLLPVPTLWEGCSRLKCVSASDL